MVFPNVEVRSRIYELHTDTLNSIDLETQFSDIELQRLKAEHSELAQYDDLSTQEDTLLRAIYLSLMHL